MCFMTLKGQHLEHKKVTDTHKNTTLLFPTQTSRRFSASRSVLKAHTRTSEPRSESNLTQELTHSSWQVQDHLKPAISTNPLTLATLPLSPGDFLLCACILLWDLCSC